MMIMLTNGNDKYRYENFKKKPNDCTLVSFLFFKHIVPVLFHRKLRKLFIKSLYHGNQLFFFFFF